MEKSDEDPNLRVVISGTEERVTKRFGIRREICRGIEEYITREDLGDPEDDSSDGLMLASLLFKIHGIQAVVFEGYDIYVTIGSAFDWKEDELAQKVKSTISQYLKTQSLIDGASGKDSGK